MTFWIVCSCYIDMCSCSIDDLLVQSMHAQCVDVITTQLFFSMQMLVSHQKLLCMVWKESWQHTYNTESWKVLYARKL